MKKLGCIIVILILIEISIRIFSPCQDRLQNILKILNQDSTLSWRQKPRLDVLFEGHRVRTNSQGFRADKEYALKKRAHTLRIVCLGASPTFGWGVDFSDTYPQQLEKILQLNYPGDNFEVINAGMIGYSSYQGIKFLKNEILRYSPDIITVAYVINDVDRYRFFRSNGKADKELSQANQAVILLRNLFSRSRLLEYLKKFVNISIPGRNIILPEVRVSARDYEGNLVEIINIARQNNLKLIFIKFPVNLPLPPLAEEAQQEDAKKIEAYRCRIDSEKYNSIMEEVANRYNVQLVDVVSAFKKEGAKQLFVDPKFDPIHPNKLGHRIIAEEICNGLKNYLRSN